MTFKESTPFPVVGFAAVGAAGLILGFLGAGLPLWMVAAGLAGIALLVAAIARPEIALTGLLAGAPLISWKAPGPLPVDSVVIGIALLLTAAGLDYLRHGESAKSGAYALPLALFLSIGAVSLIFALDRLEGATVWMRYAGYFLLVFAVARAVRSRDHLVAYAGIALVAAAVSALFGLEQYLNRPDLSIGMAGLDLSIKGRIAGTYENPNFFGEYLVLLIPLGIALALAPGSRARRASFGVLALILTVALVLTYTRGSWLSLALGLAVFALLTKRWLLWVFGAAALAALAALPGIASRLLSSFDLSQGTGAFRLKLWRIPAQMIADHPVLGVGLGNYLATFTEYVFRDPNLSVGWVQYGAHNSYLTIWAETGTLGLLAFLLVAGAALRSVISLHRRVAGKDPFIQYVNAALAAGITGFLFNSMTSNSLLHPRAAVFFWILIGLQLGLSRLAPETAERRVSRLLDGSLLAGWVRGVIPSLKAGALSSQALRPLLAVADARSGSRLLQRLFAYPPGYSAISGSRVAGWGIAVFDGARRLAAGSGAAAALSGIAGRPALSLGSYFLCGVAAYALGTILL